MFWIQKLWMFGFHTLSRGVVVVFPFGFTLGDLVNLEIQGSRDLYTGRVTAADLKSRCFQQTGHIVNGESSNCHQFPLIFPEKSLKLPS